MDIMLMNDSLCVECWLLELLNTHMFLLLLLSASIWSLVGKDLCRQTSYANVRKKTLLSGVQTEELP